MIPHRTLALLLAALPIVVACEQKPSPAPAATATATSTAPAPIPTYFAAFDPPKHAPDPVRVALGYRLFFDTRLSGDGTMSCATCHDPAKGWTDGVALGTGHDGKRLARNTPTVVNADFRLPVFWDGRAATLEAQALMPVENPDEMAMDLERLVTTLLDLPEYVALFARAFPDPSITKERIAQSLADFERSIVSSGSPFDRYVRGDASALDAQARHGMDLFAGKAECTKCHEGPQLTDNGFHNIGLKGDDPGRFKIVEVAAMRGAFKTPGLRDVARTAPYFHDGSAATLEAVVEHYDQGGVVKDNLDASIHPLHLTPPEKKAIVAFLNALTGTTPQLGPPPLPRTTVSKKPIKQLMKQADGMLDTLDKLFESLQDDDFGTAHDRLGQLVETAEAVDVTRGDHIREHDWPQFRRLQGALILGLRDLDESVERRDKRAASKRYEQVRKGCDDCHDVFRRDEKRAARSK